jgi:hypothetical protein
MELFAACISPGRMLSLKLMLVLLFPCVLFIWTLRVLAVLVAVGSRPVRLRAAARGSPQAVVGRLQFLISLLGYVSAPSVRVLSFGLYRYRLSLPTESPLRRGGSSLVRDGCVALRVSPASILRGDALLSLCVALFSSVELVLDFALCPFFVAPPLLADSVRFDVPCRLLGGRSLCLL